VNAVRVDRSLRTPVLTSDTQVVGTQIPTLVDPDVSVWKVSLPQQQVGFTWPRFEERVVYVFNELQKAWSTRNWEKSRPYETDGLFQTHAYWINEYRKQGLINVLSDVRVTKLELARVSVDKFYIGITVRIFAQMIDYTSNEKGALVCGDSRKPRFFTEYWTLIRSAKLPSSKPGDRNCPACGAPLKVNMAGNCEFCHAQITSGEFDWVLSKIEQDETYA
jgi:hypothetical protein